MAGSSRVEDGPTGGWCSDAAVSTALALEVLGQAEIEIVGRLVEASNATLYCELRLADPLPDGTAALHAVYKPIRGERPLADFPTGTLAFREVAAWEVSQALGWSIVPPTVLRDGPLGRGALQLWIDADGSQDLLRLILTRDPRLRRFAVFDALVNNADRKGGHILPTESGHLHGCDHGICFATGSKLRTVLWGWHGEPLLADELEGVARLREALDGELGLRLRELLSAREVQATRARIERSLREGTMPIPDPRRRVIPWPPF